MEWARSENESIVELALSRRRHTSHVKVHTYINVRDARLRMCEAATVAVGNIVLCSVLQCASYNCSVLQRDALSYSDLRQAICARVYDVACVAKIVMYVTKYLYIHTSVSKELPVQVTNDLYVCTNICNVLFVKNVCNELLVHTYYHMWGITCAWNKWLVHIYECM